MNKRQQLFCDEYLIDLNATQAAIRAGYSEKTAYSIGEENLKKPELKEYIDKRIEERQKRTELTQDMVINELKAIAFCNATKFASVKNGIVYINNTDDLEEDTKKAIVGIKEGKNGIEITSAGKIQASEMLGKHLGMFKEKIEISKSSEITDEIDNYIQERMSADDR